MMTPTSRFAIALSILLLSFSEQSIAQQSTGSIRVITLPKTARVSVELTEITSGVRVASAVTDTSGTARFYDIPFGAYILRSIIATDTSTYIVTLNSIAGTEVIVGTDTARVSLMPYPALTHAVFPRAQIERMPSPGEAHRIESMMLNAPGVVPGENGRWFIRGEESGLLTTIDGFPIYTDITRLNSTLINANIIRSADLLRGGVNAEFGQSNVLAITSQTGIGRQFSGRAYQTLGTFSISEQGAVIGGGINQNIGYFVAYNNYSSNRFLDPLADFEPKHAHGSQSTIFGKIDLLLGRDLDVVLLGTYNDGSYSIPNSGVDAATRQDVRATLFDYLFGARVNWRVSNTSALGFLGYTRSNLMERRAGGLSTIGDSATTVRAIAENDRYFLAGDREIQAHGGLLEYSAKFDWGDNEHALKIGVGGETIPLTQSLTFAVTDSNVANDAFLHPRFVLHDISSGGSPFIMTAERDATRLYAYAQDDIMLSDVWSLGIGVRYDSYELNEQESSISPRAMTAYRITPEIAVRASYNATFTPTPLENVLIRPTTDTGINFLDFVGFSDQRSQTAHIIEAGLRWAVSDYIDVDVSGYVKVMDEMIATTQLAFTDFLLPINLDEASITGGELELRLKNWNSISAQVNLSYSSAVARAQGSSVLTGGPHVGPNAEYYLWEGVSNDVATLHSQDLAASWLFTYDEGAGYFFTLGGRFDGGLPFTLRGSIGAPLTAEQTRAELLAMGYSEATIDLLEIARGAELSRTDPRFTLDLGAGLDLRKFIGLPIRVSGAIINALDAKYLTRFIPMVGGAHHGRPRTFVLTLEAAY